MSERPSCDKDVAASSARYQDRRTAARGKFVRDHSRSNVALAETEICEIVRRHEHYSSRGAGTNMPDASTDDSLSLDDLDDDDDEDLEAASYPMSK